MKNGKTLSAMLFAVTVFASAEPGQWQLTGNLNTARRAHTATRLLDGRILVAGGLGQTAALASTEIYDPNSGSWTNAGNLSVARHEHTATLLSDGRVLVAGGQSSSGVLPSAEIYTPATNSWSATGAMNNERAKHSATLLPNGGVLVAGGFGGGGEGALASAEIYNPASRSWSAAGNMNDARESHAATLLLEGRVLVTGGFSAIVVGQFSILKSAELFDPAQQTWTRVGDMNETRASHTATLLAGGKVVAAGGQNATAELYDPAGRDWSPTGPMQAARSSHTATLINDGRVLAAGGLGASELNSSEVFDPKSGRWTAQGNLATARAFHAAALLPNGNVLAAGGRSTMNGPPLGTAEIYEPGPSPAPDVLVYSQLAVGGGFSVVLFVTNTGSSTWTGRADLNGGAWPPSQAWTLDSLDRTGTSGFEVQLAPAETRKYNLGSGSAASSGWLEIKGSGESTVQNLATAFFFNFVTGNQLEDSTGVAAAQPATTAWFPVERTASVNTGVAIRLAPAPMTFTLYGPNGAVLQRTQQSFEDARFFDQIFNGVPANFVGSVKVESAVSFHLTVLRQEILSLSPLRFQLTSIPAK